MSTIEFRAARFDEFPLAAALRQEMSVEMGGDFDALAPGWRAKFCQYFGGKQAAGNAQLFLAFDTGQAVGCATISILDDYRNFVFNQRAAHVNAVFVKPAYRRRGIARRLMELAVAWARERGCTRVRLRASDEGRLLYQTLGFAAGREMELSF